MSNTQFKNYAICIYSIIGTLKPYYFVKKAVIFFIKLDEDSPFSVAGGPSVISEFRKTALLGPMGFAVSFVEFSGDWNPKSGILYAIAFAERNYWNIFICM